MGVCVHLQSFGGRWWSLELQREHASVEGQVVELHSLTEDREEERSLGQGVGGYLGLSAGRHFALLTLNPSRSVRTSNVDIEFFKVVE